MPFQARALFHGYPPGSNSSPARTRLGSR